MIAYIAMFKLQTYVIILYPWLWPGVSGYSTKLNCTVAVPLSFDQRATIIIVKVSQ